MTLARRKRFNTEKFIEDCVKKLDKLYRSAKTYENACIFICFFERFWVFDPKIFHMKYGKAPPKTTRLRVVSGCRIVIVLLSLIIIFYGAFGKSNLNPDVDRKEISLLMLCIQLFIICPSIYSCQFIESAKIPIITTIPVILFLGVMSIHIIGYLFMNEGCDFFTHRTFAIGCGVILACVTIGFVCYKVMNWCKSFIDFYSETEIVLEYAK